MEWSFQNHKARNASTERRQFVVPLPHGEVLKMLDIGEDLLGGAAVAQ